jgi:hypothetical protein
LASTCRQLVGPRRSIRRGDPRRSLRHPQPLYPFAGSRPPAALFFYSPDRKGDHPQRHLKDFRGVIHADGYAGFNELFIGGRIVEAGRWAHVRRKFFDVHAATGVRLLRLTGRAAEAPAQPEMTLTGPNGFITLDANRGHRRHAGPA